MNKKEEQSVMEGVAAHKIARQWLEFARRCIVERGLRPCRLSDTAGDYAVGEWETDGLMEKYRYTRASRDRIAASAINNARQRLLDGEFPEVKQYLIDEQRSVERPPNVPVRQSPENFNRKDTTK